MPAFRTFIWFLLFASGVGALALYFVFEQRSEPASFRSEFSMSRIGGGEFVQADMRGAASIIYFGRSECAAPCQQFLSKAFEWQDILGLSPQDLQIIYFNIDPQREESESLSALLRRFEGIVGLFGTEQQINRAKISLIPPPEFIPDEPAADELIEQSSAMFLFDRTGEFVSTVAQNEDIHSAIIKIENLYRR